MRILIVTFFYHPEPNDVKAHILAKNLVKLGHDVTVITTFPNYPDGKIYAGYKQKWRQWEEKDNVSILRVPLYPDHSRSGLKRALSYSSFMFNAAFLGMLLTSKCDVIWAYNPPLTTIVSGFWLSLVKRSPYVIEIQDMWPETLASTGMFSNKTGLKIIGRIAKFLYRFSSGITVISNGFKDNLVAKGVPSEKVHVLPNWTANEDIYIPQSKDLSLSEQYGLSNKFNVIIAGNLGPAQSLETVIDAAELLRDLPNLQIVFIGDGLELPKLKDSVNQKQLNNVLFIPRQPSTKIPEFLAWADVLLVHLKDDPLFHMTIPSRTMSYMACGRPIICALAGDGADIIRDAEAGLICTPENAVEVAEAIEKMYNMPVDEREQLGLNARSAYEAKYHSAVQVSKYEEIFQDLVHKQKGSSS